MPKKQKIKLKEVNNIYNCYHYVNLDPDITPDHNAELAGRVLEVEKDVEKDRLINPQKVFKGFKGGKKPKKELEVLNDKNKKKILSMDKNLGNSSKVIKYGL
tara:strand:- start:3534 stop:3839 length:306 start_codon:yes stop_codon:yes gene_type:complete